LNAPQVPGQLAVLSKNNTGMSCPDKNEGRFSSILSREEMGGSASMAHAKVSGGD